MQDSGKRGLSWKILQNWAYLARILQDSFKILQDNLVSLRSQTVHWISAEFRACMFMVSRDNSLNMLNFCRNYQRKWMNERTTKRMSLLRNPLTIHKMQNLAAQWWKILHKVYFQRQKNTKEIKFDYCYKKHWI